MAEPNSADDKYRLDTPPNQFYANIIMEDMQRFQFLMEQRYKTGTRFRNAFFSLAHFIGDMPPKGQDFMVEKNPELKGFDWDTIYSEFAHTKGIAIKEVYSAMDKLYTDAKEWLWPNLLEAQVFKPTPRESRPKGKL